MNTWLTHTDFFGEDRKVVVTYEYEPTGRGGDIGEILPARLDIASICLVKGDYFVYVADLLSKSQIKAIENEILEEIYNEF